MQAVETRATLVKTYSGRLVIIPNSDIYTRSVTVNTAYEHRRNEIEVPVGLEVDLEAAMAVLREATLAVPDVLAEPPPDVLPWEFKDNNVNIRLRWWTKSQRTYEVRTRAAVVFAVKQACEEAGIALPADTKISFAETPLRVEQAKTAKAKPKRLAKKPDKNATPAFTDPTTSAKSSIRKRKSPNSASLTKASRNCRANADHDASRATAASISLRHSASSCSAACSLRTSSRAERARSPMPAPAAIRARARFAPRARPGSMLRHRRALASAAPARSAASSSRSPRSRPISDAKPAAQAALFGERLGGGPRRPRTSSSSLAPCGGCGAPSCHTACTNFDALLAQDALHAADGVALAVEQMADAAQQIDVVGPVIAPPAAALHRLDVAEAAFPETQHVLRQIEFVRHFADGAKCVRRLVIQSAPLSLLSWTRYWNKRSRRSGCVARRRRR